MLLAHTGDLHLKERDPNFDLEEQTKFLINLGADAAKSGTEIMLVAGDVFDAESSIRERNAAMAILGSWAHRFPVIVVRGNHDKIGDLLFLSRLSAPRYILVFERSETIEIGNASIACLPWPQKAHLVAQHEGKSSLENGNAARAALDTILLGFATEFQKHEGPRILLAHAELGSALSDCGQPMVGKCDIELAESDLLGTDADYIALGHIHRAQTLSEKIRYPGSPRQMTFGEEGGKGYSLVSVERGEKPKIEHREIPSRELVTLTGSWTQGHPEPSIDWNGRIDAVPKGSSVRLTYEADEACRAEALQNAMAVRETLLKLGAHSVKLDPRIALASRVRSETITGAKTTREKIEAYWSASGNRPSGEKVQAIFAKLEQIEREVQP